MFLFRRGWGALIRISLSWGIEKIPICQHNVQTSWVGMGFENGPLCYNYIWTGKVLSQIFFRLLDETPQVCCCQASLVLLDRFVYVLVVLTAAPYYTRQSEGTLKKAPHRLLSKNKEDDRFVPCLCERGLGCCCFHNWLK